MDEERALLEDALERFLADHYDARFRRDLLASASGSCDLVWRAFAELGWLGAPLPTEYGGGGSRANLAVIARAFGRRLVLEPFIPTVVLAGAILRRGGSEAQKRALIPRIVDGSLKLAVAFAEPSSRYNLANVAVAAIADQDGFLINGAKTAVLGGASAAKFIVSIRTSGSRLDTRGVSLVLVDADSPGVRRRDYRTVHGMDACEISFENLRVPFAALVGDLDHGLPLLEAAMDEATAAACAEALGAMEAATEQTLAYCRTREAFGGPLSKLQAVRHQLVEMQVALAHAEAMVERVFTALDAEPARRMAAVSAAKVQLAKEMAFVGKTAVQLHGAMGVADETEVSHCFRRLTALQGLFGDAEHHLRRFMACNPTSPANAEQALEMATEMADLTPEDLAFRDQVRRFYAENLTDEFRQAADRTLWHMSEFEYGRRWQQILFQHGYGAPEWPVEHGGCDWTPRQQLIWNAETALARAPSVMGMGRVYCGPCVMKFGTKAQKREFLPRILSGEDWWAQGYSEPGAGSDLAALQLSAISDGDDYVLNGSKIWTTFAHHANRIFCLVRTAVGERKQDGVTFLLVDMDSPGIELRPILNLAGSYDFNQVFFTDVRVPKARRLGEENQGWTVARHLLLYEHGANLARANIENIRRLGWVREIAALEDDGFGRRLLDDPQFARGLAEVEIELAAVDFAARQAFERAGKSEPPDPRCELLTLRSRVVGQRLTELAVEAVAYHGLPHQPEALKAGGPEPIGPAHALLPMPFYLTQRAATIAGGAPEVHKNNLAKTLLRL